MPKEMTHWHVAHKSLFEPVPANIAEIATKYKELYYIGAVAHDIPFYDLSQPPETSIERIGNQLHGIYGENTLVPIMAMLKKALKHDHKMPLLAFLLGMLTHYITDSTFHPMIYYFSGNYYDPNPEARSRAVFRHRLLETALDLWIDEPLSYPVNLASLWKSAGPDGHFAFDLLVDYYTINKKNKTMKHHFKAAWRNHRLLQTAFNWSVPWHILSLYRHLGHPGIEKHEALFYPQPINLSSLQSFFHWHHPVTGQYNTLTFKNLYEDSVKKAAALFSQLGSTEADNWPEVLQEQVPYSLDSGLPYVSVNEMKYFSDDPIEVKLKSY